jgi:hypothetical protein
MSYKIPQVVVIVNRGPMEKPSRICSEHEIPILAMIHTAGDPEIDHEATAALNGAFKVVDSVGEEYATLAHRYGDDEKTGMTLVERVFINESRFAEVLAQYADDAEEDADDLQEGEEGSEPKEKAPRKPRTPK